MTELNMSMISDKEPDMNVINFPPRRACESRLTDPEHQSIIAVLYRVGISDYDQAITKEGKPYIVGWKDKWNGHRRHIRKFGAEFALCDDQTFSVLATSRRLEDVLATLV